jgi:hypothetical protein
MPKKTPEDKCPALGGKPHEHLISRDLAVDPIIQGDIAAVDSMYLAVCKHCGQVAIKIRFHIFEKDKKVPHIKFVVLTEGRKGK